MTFGLLALLVLATGPVLALPGRWPSVVSVVVAGVVLGPTSPIVPAHDRT
jgi:hypothetical protein